MQTQKLIQVNAKSNLGKSFVNASNALNTLIKDGVLNKSDTSILQIHRCSISNETMAFRSAIAPAKEKKNDTLLANQSVLFPRVGDCGCR